MSAVKATKKQAGKRSGRGVKVDPASSPKRARTPARWAGPVVEAHRLLVELLVLDAEQDAAPSLEDMARRAGRILLVDAHAANWCEKCEVLSPLAQWGADGRYLCPWCRWGCTRLPGLATLCACGHTHSDDSDGGPGPCRDATCGCADWREHSAVRVSRAGGGR